MTIKSFFFVLILLLATVLQSSFLPLLNPFQTAPNLVLVLVLIWRFLRPEKIISEGDWPLFEFFLGAVLAGVILDLFSGLPFGLISLSFLITIYLIDRLTKNVFGRINFWTLSVLVLIAALFYNLLLIGLTRATVKELTIVPYLFPTIFLEMIYNLILFWLIRGLSSVLRQRTVL